MTPCLDSVYHSSLVSYHSPMCPIHHAHKTTCPRSQSCQVQSRNPNLDCLVSEPWEGRILKLPHLFTFSVLVLYPKSGLNENKMYILKNLRSKKLPHAFYSLKTSRVKKWRPIINNSTREYEEYIIALCYIKPFFSSIIYGFWRNVKI